MNNMKGKKLRGNTTTTAIFGRDLVNNKFVVGIRSTSGEPNTPGNRDDLKSESARSPLLLITFFWPPTDNKKKETPRGLGAVDWGVRRHDLSVSAHIHSLPYHPSRQVYLRRHEVNTTAPSMQTVYNARSRHANRDKGYPKTPTMFVNGGRRHEKKQTNPYPRTKRVSRQKKP